MPEMKPGDVVVKSVLCGRADGSTFIVQLPDDVKVMTTFEDPPESQCAPDEPPPDVVVYCKSVQAHETEDFNEAVARIAAESWMA